MRLAVLPAAGLGTRVRAVASGPKELISVAGRALIAHALADLAASGITDVLVVTSPGKPELARTLGSQHAGLSLHYAVQESPRGLADALSLAESFAAREPFVCWLPDNLWSGERPAAAQLVAALRHAPGSHAVALIELPASDVERFGAAGYVETEPAGEPDFVRIDRVLDKGARPAAASVPGACLLKGFPLDLFQPDLFERIRAERARRAAGELDDTPILQGLAREGRLAGVVLRGGRLFDCGIPAGLAAARAALGGE